MFDQRKENGIPSSETGSHLSQEDRERLTAAMEAARVRGARLPPGRDQRYPDTYIDEHGIRMTTMRDAVMKLVDDISAGRITAADLAEGQVVK